MKKTLFLIFIAAVQSLAAQNVGIGTNNPGSKMHIVSGSSGYAGSFFPGAVLEGDGNTYLNILTPNGNESSILFGKQSDAASGGIVYNNAATLNGLQFRTNGNSTKMVLDQNGNVGIGNNNPSVPLSFSGNYGHKISLWSDGGPAYYGLGVQSGLFQVFAKTDLDNIAFGYGSSSNFNERARFINTGADGMELKGRIVLKNGTTDLNNGGGTWLYKADNSALLGFMGTQNNQNIGFYGGPAGWGFTYDAINSRVGIGNHNPNAPLAFPAALGKKITLYPGASGDAGISVQGNLLQVYSDNPNADIAFGYDQSGTMTERMRIKANGSVGIGTNAPNALLEVNGYTKLGSDAPSIKVKKLTGTTGATEGGFVFISHGLNPAKILAVSVMVQLSVPTPAVGPNSQFPGANFMWVLNGTNVEIDNIPGQSAFLLSKPVIILITYEE